MLSGLQTPESHHKKKTQRTEPRLVQIPAPSACFRVFLPRVYSQATDRVFDHSKRLPPCKSISFSFPNSTAFRRPAPPTPFPLATRRAVSHSYIQWFLPTASKHQENTDGPVCSCTEQRREGGSGISSFWLFCLRRRMASQNTGTHRCWFFFSKIFILQK